jgi:enediyne biosynthesis protein E4
MFPMTNFLSARSTARCAIAAVLLLHSGAHADSQLLPEPAATAQKLSSPIHFFPQSIAFTLDSSESPARHAPETMAGGVAVFDYDRDGRPDIFFVNGAPIDTLIKDAPKYWNRLFHNNGDGTFTDVTERAGLKGTGFDVGVAIGDYDNDGYDDIFVAGVYRNTLYHNNGDGTFTDVTEKAGLAQADKQYGPLWSVSAVWGDFDNDGHLDLFVVNYLSWDGAKEPNCMYNGKPEYCHPKFFKSLPSQLFHNNGNGTFTDISDQAGIRAHPGKGMSACIADYDNDGLPSIFVTNDKMFNFLFHNKGHNRFEEVAFETGVALPEHGNLISGMGCDFRDLNNDGIPDIVLTALQSETFPIYQGVKGGSWEEVTARTRMTVLSNPMSGYGVNIADFDNDGWKDIFVARGDVLSPNLSGTMRIAQPNTVFRNVGGKWNALTEEAGFGALPTKRHRGSAVADFNGDGKLDLVVTALSAPAEIWINDSPVKSHWIELALEGTRSNRDGIGARITVTAGGKTQYNHMTSAGSYASSSVVPVHFGLGDASAADEIDVHWPSGTVQTLKNVEADKMLHLKEPQ